MSKMRCPLHYTTGEMVPRERDKTVELEFNRLLDTVSHLSCVMMKRKRKELYSHRRTRGVLCEDVPPMDYIVYTTLPRTIPKTVTKLEWIIKIYLNPSLPLSLPHSLPPSLSIRLQEEQRGPNAMLWMVTVLHEIPTYVEYTSDT